MKRFWVLMALVIVTAVGLLVVTLRQASRYPKGSQPEVAGLPVACMEDEPPETWFPMSRRTPCWISVGGTGIVVLGMGTGVVAFGFVGFGLLFGAGQLAFGLVAMGQGGMGLAFFAGQVGLGLTGFGQGIFGWRVVSQGGERHEGRRFLDDLGADVNDLFRFP